MLARDDGGQVRCFPVAENQHRHGILDISSAPARVPDQLQMDAMQIAEGIAQKLNYVGTMAVEFLLSAAACMSMKWRPVPTIQGTTRLTRVTSQFEQQVRTLCNLPLGDASAHSAAVMVNLLGDLWYQRDAHHSHEPDWQNLLAKPNVKLHLYGKHHARPGRKMGHFTVLDREPQAVYELALTARRQIGITDD